MSKKIIYVAIFFLSAAIFSQEPKNLGSLFYKEVTADIETEPVFVADDAADDMCVLCLLYTSPSPRDRTRSRMPSSA